MSCATHSNRWPYAKKICYRVLEYVYALWTIFNLSLTIHSTIFAPVLNSFTPKIDDALKKYHLKEKKKRLNRFHSEFNSIKLLCHMIPLCHTIGLILSNQFIFYVSVHFHRILYNIVKMVKKNLQLLKVIWIYIDRYEFNKSGESKRESGKVGFRFHNMRQSSAHAYIHPCIRTGTHGNTICCGCMCLNAVCIQSYIHSHTHAHAA